MAAREDVALRPVALDDKYGVEDGAIFLSGTQALVRLLLEQRRRDARAGMNTAGYVSGYRGSPLGGVDFALWKAEAQLRAAAIRFEPGLNEEIAATMVHGSQQVGAIGGACVAGVFGLWYAKNPGVDRAGDALKHANAAGTSALGGVLAVSGDDPGATSSSIANQCDHAFISAAIPVLAPANVAEIIDYGLFGYGLSRFAGVWVGLKTVADVVEASATVQVSAASPALVVPAGFARPAAGFGMRWPDSRWDQDARLLGQRLPAARAYAQANRIDRVVFGAARPRYGIVCAGKAAGDVHDALALLGIDAAAAENLGLAVYKVALVWPLEPAALRAFGEGIDEILVVEERRGVVEPQLKEQAYGWPAARQPRIVGKTDEHGAELLPEGGVLTPRIVALALARRLALRGAPAELARRAEALAPIEGRFTPIPAPAAAHPAAPELTRSPHFCAGCPHARSTRVPDDGLAMAGIGCHSLRLGMPDPKTMFMVQMGGEGCNWIGAAPFVERDHVFQNLGDGTYTHSGSLAVRAAVAAGTHMTFRLLYNGIVAMTGGQPAEGALSVAQIVRQLLAEGVSRVVVVAEEPQRHRGRLPAGVEVFGRDAMERVQAELAALPGVTVIVYDQMCAIEKRRGRKRGLLPPVAARVVINERVCEGCGDCVVQSQCSALLPVETAFGTKRRIDASACNVDLSCLKGFCPSFVTLEGATLRAQPALELNAGDLPEPALPPLREAGEIVVTGIGGAGVITVGAVLGMAAHLEGLACSVLDNTGIARKGGAVSTEVRLAADVAQIGASRIGEGRATLLIGGDLIVSAESAQLAKLTPGRAQVVLNADAVPTLNQRLAPDARLEWAPLRRKIERAAGAVHTFAATRIAERFLGDAIYANLLLLGAAWQLGTIPLSHAAIERAIELNGNGPDRNRRAFLLGRLAAHDPARIDAALGEVEPQAAAATLAETIARRRAWLTDYQDAAYGERYADRVAAVREAESRCGVAGEALAQAVADGYFRLLAIKDEYEVARLHTDGVFRRELEQRYGGPWKLHYHLAPPLFARPDPITGRPRKISFGPWLTPVLKGLAATRRVRASWFDPFGYTAERRTERRLIADYERALDAALARLTPERHALVVELASLPAKIRGYGPVKQASMALAARRRAEIEAALAER